MNQFFEKSQAKFQQKSLVWIWLTIAILLLDQFTKHIAAYNLALYVPKPIVPFFNLTLMHNNGAAFSFLSQQGDLATLLFTIIAIVVSVILFIALARLPIQRRWLACALALILGGALGNLIDRFTYGYVIDFLDFYFEQWHFPTFNLADSAITVGAIMLFIDILFFKKRS